MTCGVGGGKRCLFVGDARLAPGRVEPFTDLLGENAFAPEAHAPWDVVPLAAPHRPQSIFMVWQTT